MLPRLAPNSQSSCLSLLGTRIAAVYHHVKTKLFLEDIYQSLISVFLPPTTVYNVETLTWHHCTALKLNKTEINCLSVQSWISNSMTYFTSLLPENSFSDFALFL